MYFFKKNEENDEVKLFKINNDARITISSIHKIKLNTNIGVIIYQTDYWIPESFFIIEV